MRMVMIFEGLAVCNVLVAAAAQAQGVSFIARRDFDAGLRPSSLAVGDFNGDGVPDLAVTSRCSDDVSVLFGTGDGTFQAARNFAVGSQPVSVAVGDFNGDGAQDLAVANAVSNNVSVLLGNGDGSFQAPMSFGAGSS